MICGLRTIEEQKALVAKGASQTMKSKHIHGNAVDLMAYIDGGRWELNLYDVIAVAMKVVIMVKVTQAGGDWMQAVDLMWDGETSGLFSAVLAFWFGNRAITKYAGK